MSEAAARPWTFVKSASERGYKVRGGKHNQIIIARYLSEEDATLIVKAVNVLDAQTEALEDCVEAMAGFYDEDSSDVSAYVNTSLLLMELRGAK